MRDFQYQWWTIEISVEDMEPTTWEFKGKSREHVISQIEKEKRFRDSEKNLGAVWYKRKQRITGIKWDTLKLDRIGYQRQG